jgi:hypothetical protein
MLKPAELEAKIQLFQERKHREFPELNQSLNAVYKQITSVQQSSQDETAGHNLTLNGKELRFA